MSAADGGVDARVLDLDRDVLALVARAVDLADRGGGDRHGVEGLEDVVELVAVLLLEDLLHVLEGDLRRRVAQLGQLGLELLAELLGDEADVQEGHHLAELHRRALHGAQGGDDLLGRLDLAAGHRVLGGLLVAGQVHGARAGLLGALGRREAADLRGARPPRGRDAIVAGHVRPSARPCCRGRCRRDRRATGPRPCGRRRSRRRAGRAWRARRAR